MAHPQPLPGLLAASFRGISFFVPDTSSEVGRRVAEHYFPGIDTCAFDDEGLHAERISIEGLYVGTDYIERGRALKEAFETAGSGTLIHPWTGAVNVLLVEPATIKWSTTELRVVRFSASFVKVIENAGGNNSRWATGSKVLEKALSLVAAARLLVGAVQRNTLSRLKTDATTRVAKQYFSLFDTLQGKGGSAIRQLLPQATPSRPDDFAELFSTVSSTFAGLTQMNAAQSAVAPAAGTQLPDPMLPERTAINFLTKAATRLIEIFDKAPSDADKALMGAAAGDLLAKMAPILTDIEPTSRTEAIEVRSTVSNVFEDFSTTLQSLCESPVFAGEATRLERESRFLQMAIIADLNETIGRLPKTTRLTLTRDGDAFALAHLFYGDNIAALEAYYKDIVSRNHLRHPAMITNNTVEVLK